MGQFDVIVVGGGIIGLATAYQIVKANPGRKLVLLEKESRTGTHQTGHNSGVLHSGIYYTPGSLKATNCRLGKKAMVSFCREHEIDFDVCGKVIVATCESELPALNRIFKRGQENGIACELIGVARLKELEPHCAGIQAIHVPDAGIVDYRQVCDRLVDCVQQAGGELVASAKVTKISRTADQVAVETTAGAYCGSLLVNCAGLHSDRVTKLSGVKPPAKIIPFRGEYFELKPEAFHLCKNLIYPVPDPSFPFLGVHFTRMIDNSIECGPNAVLAFAREGYKKTDINFGDLFESLTYGGFLRLAAKYWRVGAGEVWRSWSKRAFVKALQKLIPEIQAHQLVPAPAGVRAQAVSPNGSMVDDFLILDDDRIVNVCNAPSPAATSSLNIGKTIANQIANRS